MSLAMTPESGCRILKHQGDLITFTLTTGATRPMGHAFLRTNLGHRQAHFNEVISHAEEGQPVLNRDWHDLPMLPVESGDSWSLTLPLDEVGCFHAKAFFIPEGHTEPEWPEGDNVRLKVEPAHTIAGNSIYCAFVRQFLQRPLEEQSPVIPQEQIAQLDGAGYTVIPPAGKFRDLIPHLDHILIDMGFKNLMLLPIHPVPTTFARMGRFGSPYASMDFMDVNPALAVFDRKSTPLEQFMELVDEVHARDGRIFIDLPINHTGWASHLQVDHPEWFERQDDHAFKSPGAWGVTWEDLSELNYDEKPLWYYMAEVFLFWCRRGVDGFRCDAGYMVPAPVWEYIVARVRQEYPETVFMLEGLGGHLYVMEDLLGNSGLNWAYSELFQNYDQWQIHHCSRHADAVSHERGLMIHFAETHDNNRLASVSHTFATMRILVSGLLSHAGGFGITNGVEWFADQKINVHGNTSLSWGREPNAIDLIRRLQRLLNHHPAFRSDVNVETFDCGNPQMITAHRYAGEDSLLVLINIDTEHPQSVELPDNYADAVNLRDLLTEGHHLHGLDGRRLTLPPGQGMVVAHRASGAESAGSAVTTQRKLSRLISLYHMLGATLPVSDDHLRSDVAAFDVDPAAFMMRLANGAPVVVSFACPRDAGRIVMAAPGQVILMQSDYPFLVERRTGKERRLRSLPIDSGRHVVVVPGYAEKHQCLENLQLTLFEPHGIARHDLTFLWTGPAGNGLATARLERAAITPGHHALLTNGRGAMSHCRAAWATIGSQYDSLLAANLDNECPVDRHVLWTRCRGWVVYRGYSSELNMDCQTAFSAFQDQLIWHFDVPCGMGKRIRLDIRLHLHRDQNQVTMTAERLSAEDDLCLPDDAEVKLIFRPDVESRSFHHKTKAYSGPEAHWGQTLASSDSGFTFNPGNGATLRLNAAEGEFHHEPEWAYNVAHPVDQQRGLDGSTDVFSPGWFSRMVAGGGQMTLCAAANMDIDVIEAVKPPEKSAAPKAIAEVLVQSADHYVVARNTSRTVIAGYPWFLDWGRDSFIALRGYISLGRLDEAADILNEFGRYEQDGTIPNMIRGHDANNRDTSDAPLWYIAACKAWMDASGSDELLARDCEGRTIADVIESIVKGYEQGTPNGIKMDEASGLIFSPEHYTWMDTAHPAGTPRIGYPIEIQALWYAALTFLYDRSGQKAYLARAQQVQASVLSLYVHDNDIGLSDCLHGAQGTPAAECLADDALRSNQLLAITLGLIDDAALQSRVLTACEELLVPGAIRSLADRPLKEPLYIHFHGEQLADPHYPYRGRYEGDEDRSRKPAYHNGTAWTWMFPLYPEAFFKVHGSKGRDIALSLLESSLELLNSGCLLQLPEICDGHTPHTFRGCGAQAWGVTEWCRVHKLLKEGRRS